MKFAKQEEQQFDLRIAEYQATQNLTLRNEILIDASYIAKSVAAQMRGVASYYAQMEDLVNQGIIALIDCIDKYEPGKGMKFEGFAFFRVRMAMIDFIRKSDWVPRRVRKLSKEIKAAYDAVANQQLREPTDKEIAAHLGISEQTLAKTYQEAFDGIVLSFESILSPNGESGEYEGPADTQDIPENIFLKKEMEEELKQALDSLKEQERIVVSLYYFEHLRLREIGEVLGVSEARVCQVHSKALLKLQTILQSYR